MKKTLASLTWMFTLLALFLVSCSRNTPSGHDNTAPPSAATSKQIAPTLTTKDSAPCVGDEASECIAFLKDIGINPVGFEHYPNDLKLFIDNAAMCEHFAGEEPYDEQRRQEISQALDKSCPEAKKLSLLLKKKYAGNGAFSKILAVCDAEMPTACAGGPLP